MPLIKSTDQQLSLPRAFGDPVFEAPEPTFKELMKASFRMDNTVGSFLSGKKGMPDNVVSDEGFNPWDYFSEQEKLDDKFVSTAAMADSEQEIDAVRAQRDRENRDRATIESGGGLGFVTGMAAGVFDPINLIPVGGAAYQSYRTGGSILKGAGVTASVAAGSEAAVEVALHHTQVTRTYGESATNIAAAALLGGTLGAGFSALAVKNNRLRDEIERSMDPEQRRTAGENSVLDNDSVGAARVENDIRVSGKIARELTKVLGYDPLSRSIVSARKETRLLASQLAENPIQMEASGGGSFVPDAVETKAKILLDGLYIRALQGHLGEFKNYKENGGTLKRREFNAEVAKEMRNPVLDQDQSVKASAEYWRKEIYDPLKDMAIDLDFLPEDVTVDTAISYLNRSYDKGAITANLDEWVRTVAPWLDEQNEIKKRIQEELTGRLDVLKNDIAIGKRLGRSIENLERKEKTLTKQLEEIRRQQKGGMERQVKLEDAALEKAIKEQEKLDAKVREELSEEFNKFQEGKEADLVKAREKAVKVLESEANKLKKKSYTMSRQIAEWGGLNREAWEAEFLDPAVYKDGSLKGGFGKPVFPKEGGMTPADLADRLLNDERIPVHSADEQTIALDLVDSMVNDGNDYIDPDVRALLDQIDRDISRLDTATDADIEDVYFGGKAEPDVEDIPLPTDERVDAGVGAEGKKIHHLTTRELRVSHGRLRRRAEILRDQLSANADKSRLAKEALERTELRTQKNLEHIEENIAEFPGKTGNEVRSAIKNRKSDEPQNLTKTIEKAARSIDARDFEEFDSEPLALEIASRIIGTPAGRLPYDYKMGENSSSSPSSPSVAGPLNNRSFVIPDKTIEKFLINDIEELGARYGKDLAMDLELTKAFGDPEMTAEIKVISEAWDKDIREASKTNPKLAIKLAKKKDRDIKDIAGMRDRLRGQFAQADPYNGWVRSWRAARDWNYLRLLGGVTASSLPDVARTVMAEGIVKTFGTGLNELIGNTKAFRASAQEGKEWGIGADALQGGRSRILADIADYEKGGTMAERGLRVAADNFSKINLMDRWTAAMKQLHHVVAQTSMANDMVAGKFDKRWENLGISQANASHIAEELRRHGEKDGRTWIANTKDWGNQELALIWGGALRKNSDRVILIPGQEKPLFMSTELGKTIWQFRSFMFSATQRMLIAGIQGQDKHPLQGALGLISLGILSYYFKQWDAGREISTDPKTLVMEGIDRSGALGILMEMNNTIEKISSNSFGMRPVLGVEQPASRFASRNMSETLLGPTFGSFLKTTLDVAAGGTQGDADIRAIRRLLPYQNLSIFRQGVDQVEDAIK